MRIKDKLFGFIGWFDRAAGTIAMVGILVFVFYQVMSRYFLGTSLSWSEEVSRYLMIYMIMIGVGAGIRRHKHLGVDALVEAMPGASRQWMKRLAGVLSAAVYLVMMYYCLQMTLRTVRSGQVSPAAAIPMALVYVSLPLGFFVGALRQVDEIMKLWQAPAGAASERESE